MIIILHELFRKIEVTFGIEVVSEDGDKNLVFSGWMGGVCYDGKKVQHFRYGDGLHPARYWIY